MGGIQRGIYSRAGLGRMSYIWARGDGVRAACSAGTQEKRGGYLSIILGM